MIEEVATTLGIEERLVFRLHRRDDIAFKAIKEAEVGHITSPMSIHLSDPQSPIQSPLLSMPFFTTVPATVITHAIVITHATTVPATVITPVTGDSPPSLLPPFLSQSSLLSLLLP